MAARPDVRDPIFLVEHVSVHLDVSTSGTRLPILTDVSMAVERGTAVSLVGPSGSGKSTLLRCLNRLIEVTSGAIAFGGTDIRRLDPRDLRQRAALVTQTPVLFDGSVRDNLRIRPPGATADLSDARLAAALEEVGLGADLLDRRAGTLSGGEKQRVTIARALLRDPEALLLDEPTSALDPPNAALVVDTIARLRDKRRLSIVAVTHRPDLVRQLAGSVVYLAEGRVRASERVDGGARSANDRRLAAFLSGDAPP